MTTSRSAYDVALRLDGRVFVVIGAGPGIGAESARVLSDLGARVVCVGRRRAPIEELAQEIDGVAAVADGEDPDQVQALFERTTDQLGHVNGIVNVIGRGIPTRATELDLDAWRWQLDNVLSSAVITVQIGGAHLAAAGGGSIVLVGSIAARRVPSDQPLFAYSAAKAAVEQLVRVAAVELGPKAVRVNVVSPGLTSTPRGGQPVDAGGPRVGGGDQPAAPDRRADGRRRGHRLPVFRPGAARHGTLPGGRWRPRRDVTEGRPFRRLDVIGPDRGRVGVVGAGRMGGAFTIHLVAAGYEVWVVDPSPAAVERGRERGCRIADTVEAMWSTEPTAVLLSLATEDAFRDVVESIVRARRRAEGPLVPS